jgi:hypothetical protein
MPDAPPPATPPLRRALAVAVGLFATWQLVYLPAANLIDFIPRRPRGPELEPISDPYQRKGTFSSAEPLQRAAECTGDVLDFWSEASAQEQGWSLFAPGMPPYSIFAAFEFHFADGSSDTVLSQFEPADKRRPPLRPPLVNNRLFNAEAQLIYPVTYAPPEEIARQFMQPGELEQLPEMWRDLPDVVRAWRGPFRAWMAWKVKQYMAAHPERGTPTAVILKHRFILTPKPGEPAEWTSPPVERPFVRWRPASDTYEAYDAIKRDFVPVEAKP